MKIVTCKMPWSSRTLKVITNLSKKYCGFFMFVEEEPSHSGDGIILNKKTELDNLFLESLSSWLVEKRERKEWPGTIQTGEGIGVQTYKCAINDETIYILIDKGMKLFAEEKPSFLEDLSFLRPDGTPWFITIKHERDAYFKLYPEEMEGVSKVLGKSVLLVEGEDKIPEERY